MYSNKRMQCQYCSCNKYEESPSFKEWCNKQAEFMSMWKELDKKILEDYNILKFKELLTKTFEGYNFETPAPTGSPYEIPN